VIESYEVTATELQGSVSTRLQDGYRMALVAGHEDEGQLRVVYVLVRAEDDRRVELVLRVPADDPVVPSLAGLDYATGRFERELHDLYGIVPDGHPLPARLVRHAHWPSGWYPMRRGAGSEPPFEPDVGSFPFLEVEGDGVYEIPVGPVHAGLIEPGHFRFSVVGETVLRMKARLWFVHRGVEKLFEGRDAHEGVALAERISGDTAVGHATAYATAIEDALEIEVSTNDRLLRALLLELERMHNHIADLGALANDVGFGIVNMHTQRLRETLLRLNRRTTGHRLLREAITIGGVRVAELPDASLVASVASEAAEVVAITLSNSTVLDRFTGTAVLSTDAARELGTLGFVARASAVDVDARRDHPVADLGPVEVVVETGGDVLARYRVRARELQISARTVVALLDGLVGDHGSGTRAPAAGPAAGTAAGTAAGLGLVEGWRGTIAHRVEIGPAGRLTRVKVVDPSFFNWPALPVALAGTIVPDFPLANKSFNQSYAGNDL
jgi:Ni,Fe-hydrogenase III large subunit/Ni,Fe-hydrogenase III component G